MKVIITHFMGSNDFCPYLHFTGGLIVNYESIETPDKRDTWLKTLSKSDLAIANNGFEYAKTAEFRQLYEHPIETKDLYKTFFKEVKNNDLFVRIDKPDPRLRSRAIDLKISREDLEQRYVSGSLVSDVIKAIEEDVKLQMSQIGTDIRYYVYMVGVLQRANKDVPDTQWILDNKPKELPQAVFDVKARYYISK
ncbi:MAG: hypothetical protein QM489_00615 [Candidatus Izemoplasma sp.]